MQRAVRCGLLLLLSSLPALAQPGPASFENKDWKQWSREECKQVVENSPWSKTEKVKVAGGYRSVQIQFRSALPIRHALAREILIKKNYDRRSARERLDIERTIEPLLSGNYDTIVLRVILRRNGSVEYYNPGTPGHYEGGSGDGEMGPSQPGTPAYWWYSDIGYPQTGHFGALLLANGQRVNSIRRIPEKKYKYRNSAAEYELHFPRAIDGVLIGSPGREVAAVLLLGESTVKITTRMKTAKGSNPDPGMVQVWQRLTDDLNERFRNWEYWRMGFEPAKMMYNGRIEY